MTIASCLATLLAKTFNARNATNAPLIDKCPLFVSKERKANYKTAFFGLKDIPGSKANKGKPLSVRGHNFELKNYTDVTFCKLTGEMIWGIGPQGYHCSHCGYDVHKKHAGRVEEPCVGPRQPSSKGEKAVKKIMGRIRSDRDLQPQRQQQDHRKASTPGAATADWGKSVASVTLAKYQRETRKENFFVASLFKQTFFFLLLSFSTWRRKNFFITANLVDERSKSKQ